MKQKASENENRKKTDANVPITKDSTNIHIEHENGCKERKHKRKYFLSSKREKAYKRQIIRF